MNFLSSQSKLFAGLLCLMLVTVEYGGHFLRSVLKGTIPGYSAASPLLISGGFFAGALTMADGKPGALHRLIYAGLATLTVALVLLGVNLIRHRG